MSNASEREVALRQDDAVFEYRERLLGLYDGLGRKARCREELS